MVVWEAQSTVAKKHRATDTERPSRDGQSSEKPKQNQRTLIEEARDEADIHHNEKMGY